MSDHDSKEMRLRELKKSMAWASCKELINPPIMATVLPLKILPTDNDIERQEKQLQHKFSKDRYDEELLRREPDVIKEFEKLVDRIRATRHEYKQNGNDYYAIAEGVKSFKFHCSNCNNRDPYHTLEDPKRGDRICQGVGGSGCGAVVEEHHVDRSAGKRKIEGEEDKNHIGPSPNAKMSEAWNLSTTLSTTNLNSHNENATYKRLKRSQAMVEMDLSQIGNDERRTRTSYKDKMKRDADNMMSELANRYKIHPLIVKIAEDEFALYRDAKEALQDFEGIVHSCLYLAYEEATHRSEMVDIRDIHVTQLFVKRSEVKLPVADSSDAAVATLDGKPIRTWGVAHVREWLTAVATCSSTSSTQAPSISVIIKSEKQGAEASMDVVSDSLASDEFQADGKDEKPGTVADAAATAAATTTADTGAATATAGATVATTANPSTTVARRQLALLAYADGIYEYLETELATHRLRQRNGTSLSHSVTDSATAADTCTVAIADGTTTTGSTGGGNAAGEEATAAIKSENMGKVRGPPTTGITNSGLSGPIGAVSAAEQTAAVFKFLGTTTIEGRRKIEEMERKKKQQQKQHVLAVNKGRQGNEEEGAAVSTTSSSMAPVVTDDESSMGQLLVTLRFRAAVSARLREREPKHSNTQIQSSIDNPAASPLSSSLPPSSLPSLPSSSSSTSTALSFVVLSSSWTVEEVESLIAEAEKLFADAIRRRCSFERLVREAHEEMQLQSQSQSQSQSQQATGVSKKSDVAPAPPNKTAKLTQKLSSNIGGQSQSHVRNALLDHVKSENGTPSTVNGSNGVRMGGLLKQRVERPLLAVAPMKDSVVDAFEDFFGASVPMVSDVSSDAQDAVDVKTEKEQDKQDGMGGKASIDGTKEIKPNAKVMKKKKVAVVVE